MEHVFIHMEELFQFGKKLREWRREAGLTIQDLSKESGVSNNTIARIERGEIDPRCKTAYKLWHSISDLSLPY